MCTIRRLLIFLILLASFNQFATDAHASRELAEYEEGKGYSAVEVKPYMDYTEEDLYLLAHIVNAEAGGANYISDTCVAGVGSVVLNRVRDPRFPNTIKEVLWQPGQYYNGWHGAITMEPSERSWEIAQELLDNGPIFPKEVVWQANFTQGAGVYLYTDRMYFCY